MNHLQLLLFFVFVLSVLIKGLGIFSLFKTEDPLTKHKCVFLGEALLLGSAFVVGELLFLSLIGLYKAPYLWGITLLNNLWLVSRDVRDKFRAIITLKGFWSIPNAVFLVLLSIFFFRNCYFLVDVDSHRLYLFIQKLWLMHGSSVFPADRGMDVQIFVPHFDCVPYSLGLSVFAKELFFPELVNTFWRILVLILVYGYTSYRFNNYFGLAAALFVLFNDHFLVSGANEWILINGAVLAFLFAAVYNLWESRKMNSSFRLLMCFIFLTQLPANKLQMAYNVIFIVIISLFVMERPFEKFKNIIRNKAWVMVFSAALFFSLLWFVKNGLVTGLPTFPFLAGKFKVLGWTQDQQNAFMHVFGGPGLSMIIKYLNYLFIWPGVNPAKIVCLFLTFLPLILFISLLRKKFSAVESFELFYWLAMSMFMLIAFCLASHQDPRFYRYPIAVYAFTSVFAINYLFTNVLGINNRIVIAGLLLIIASKGYYELFYPGGGHWLRPTVKENIGVLLDHIHTDDIIEKHYPQNVKIWKLIQDNPEKLAKSAWLILNKPSTPSKFLLPVRPQIGLWYTTLVSWDSYGDVKTIKKDLDAFGIEWVLTMKNKEPIFLSAEEFAYEAVTYERYPKEIGYPYGMPRELTSTGF